MSTYEHLAQQSGHVPVRQLCQTLRVAPATYYAWHCRRQISTVETWRVTVREAFAYHSQRYGTRRLRVEVQAQGHQVGRWRIRRVLPSTACAPYGYDPAAPPVRAQHDRLGPSRAHRAQLLAGTAGPHGPEPGVGGSYPVGRFMYLPR